MNLLFDHFKTFGRCITCNKKLLFATGYMYCDSFKNSYYHFFFNTFYRDKQLNPGCILNFTDGFELYKVEFFDSGKPAKFSIMTFNGDIEKINLDGISEECFLFKDMSDIKKLLLKVENLKLLG